MSDIDINIWDWINYRKNVGVESAHIIGLPGTGKSNMASALAVYCMQKGEHIVMPGDRFCEWRHFLEYSDVCNVIILVPQESEITYLPKELAHRTYIKKISYNKLKIMDYLADTRKPTVLAIYDACFEIGDRVHFWVEVLKQLLNRAAFLEEAITLLFHEAGVYFPENARGSHWDAVEDFSNLFVDSRKGLIRNIFVSQLQTEIYHTIRLKCMVVVHRKGFPSHRVPVPLQRAIPYTALNEFHFQYGGLYVRNNIIDCFQEKKKLYKMIPRSYINGDSLPIAAKRKSKMLRCKICHHIWKNKVTYPARCQNCRTESTYEEWES